MSIVIQAGGKSSRMGRDKALLPLRDKPLIQHILDQVGGLGADTIIIANQPGDYGHFGVPVYADIYPDTGALGGLYTAIYHAPQPYCLVLACDMPFVNRPLLEHLIALAPGHDAVVPRLKAAHGAARSNELFAEPFRAVYNKACLEPVRAALDAGKRRVISFFDQVNIRFVDWPEIEQFDPQARSFFNVNTPEDLAEAERIAAAMDK